ncbi:hypothetical protein PMAYCL1PPCAC_22986, partial [Pristionchus mayeri]
TNSPDLDRDIPRDKRTLDQVEPTLSNRKSSTSRRLHSNHRAEWAGWEASVLLLWPGRAVPAAWMLLVTAEDC